MSIMNRFVNLKVSKKLFFGFTTVFFDPILNRDKACQTRYQNGNGDE